MDYYVCSYYSSDLSEDYDDEDEDMDIEYVRKYKKPLTFVVMQRILRQIPMVKSLK